MIKLSKEAARTVNENTGAQPLAREPVTRDPVDYNQAIDDTIHEFNRRDICLMDYSQEIRHHTFELEKELTVAANRNDRDTFFRVLAEYRRCFLDG